MSSSFTTELSDRRTHVPHLLLLFSIPFSSTFKEKRKEKSLGLQTNFNKNEIGKGIRGFRCKVQLRG
ncbi:unnamed protein product [Lactuca virosa]|uniref:Uncharacterized protein n=1 Tax=Lactuca virosa TaxID=75947 RepID=A0AAU9MXP3_9ASTR|nr:unnamed protein product [Lactuca virosa]CAH1449394.1 unnamed protein product [Lactuca virosa]